MKNLKRKRKMVGKNDLRHRETPCNKREQRPVKKSLRASHKNKKRKMIKMLSAKRT